MQKGFCLIFIFIVAEVVYTGDFYEGDSVVSSGVYAFYNYEFEKAINILTTARSEFPEHPGVHLIWAASRWVNAQANECVEQTYVTLERDLEEIIPVYDSLVYKYDYDNNYKLYLGSAKGLVARVSLGKKQWIKTFYNAYGGFVIINKVARSTPGLIDAQLPIGIVEYYAGINTPILRFVLGLYNIEPSTESGLKKIALAADEGHWSWIEAKAILCNLYLWVENEPILAIEHSKVLAQRFPNNFYFNLLFLESMIRTVNDDVTKALLREMENKSHELSDRQKDWYIPYLEYEKALFAFYQKDYLLSLELVRYAIDNYTAELDLVLGHAYLLQGMVYDKLYKRGKAKESYYDCIRLDNYSGAIVKAKKYLREPFIRIE